MNRSAWDGMIEIEDTFVEKVYEQVARIPFGKISTYGKIGELAGYPGAAREVGVAMSRVPEKSDLPCHRVVNKNGTLAPGYAFGGKEKQRKLLLQEGITFREDGLIYIEKHMWPDESGGEQLSLFA